MDLDQLIELWAVDWTQALDAARKRESIADGLAEELPCLWLEKYVELTPHETHVLRVVDRGFTYIYDWYSRLEDGSIPYNPKIEDRVVGAFGISRESIVKRDVSRQRRWVGPTEKRFGANRNKGRYIANAVGGGLELNVFDQSREINLGRSERGRLYRRMERYCAENLGTFFFTRPFYTDTTSRPAALEFGILMPDQSLWVEHFEN